LAATLGVGSLVFGIIESAERGWSSPVGIGALVVAAVVLTVLVKHEARVEQPIMPLQLFADCRRLGANAARFLYLGAMMGSSSPPSSCRTSSGSPPSRPGSGSCR
jgi:hypothetical protein